MTTEYKIAPDGYEYPTAYNDPDVGSGGCPECGHWGDIHATEGGCIARGRKPGTKPRSHQCRCSYGNRSTSEQRIHALQDMAAGMSVLSAFHKDTYRAEVGLTVSGEDLTVKDAQNAAYAVLEALRVLEKDREKEE